MLNIFKKINKYLFAWLIINIFNTVNAAGNWITDPAVNWVARPYCGLEYKLSYTNGQLGWKKLLPTNKLYNTGTIFTGIKFLDYVAGEFGVTRSNSHTKDSDVSSEIMFGTASLPGTRQSIKLSYTSWFLDINLQSVPDGFALLGTIGVGGIKPKIQAINQGARGNFTVGGNDAVAVIQGRSKMVLRLGFGFQMTKGILGMRSRIIWESTSRLKAHVGSMIDGYSTIFPNVTNRPFGETFSWNLGFFVIL